jgi:hypothetical protein
MFCSAIKVDLLNVETLATIVHTRSPRLDHESSGSARKEENCLKVFADSSVEGRGSLNHGVVFQDEVLASIEVTSNWKSSCPISSASQPMHLNAVDAELLQKGSHDIGVEEYSFDLLVSCSMNLDPEDLAASYAKMGEPELVELARSYDSLTDSAQAVLRAEFGRRNLDPPIIEDSDDVPDRRDLVTVHRYRDLSEAIVARTLLESAGIYVFLCDENLVRLDWQVSNFIGGIRLQVEAKDQREASELLSQSTPVVIPFGGEADFFQPRCPNCGSTDITFQGSSRGAALASLYVLSLPLPLGRETWLCNSCESRWEPTEDDSI